MKVIKFLIFQMKSMINEIKNAEPAIKYIEISVLVMVSCMLFAIPVGMLLSNYAITKIMFAIAVVDILQLFAFICFIDSIIGCWNWIKDSYKKFEKTQTKITMEEVK